MVTAKDMNGYTTVNTERDGVFLTVFPPAGKGSRVTLEQVKQELVKHKVAVENPALLGQMVVQASGKPQKIAGTKAAAAKVEGGSEQVFVEISDDEMLAKITVVPPQSENDHFATIDDVRAELKRRNVVFGVDEGLMEQLAEKLSQVAAAKNLTEPVEMEIAHGTAMVNGEDARVEYLFKAPESEAQEGEAPPQEDEEGRVDYRAAHKIDNVTKGTLLARKIPATKGVAGMTVTGTATETKEGKDIEVVATKGVVQSPDNKDEFIADSDGQVIVKDNKISVLAIYEVPGDVNLATGNIEFVGTVVVRGDVKEGFKVNAGEDLIVNGVVEGAELKCNGKLTIAGGVSGNDKAKIACGGDANIKYIRNATVDVGGSLTCSQAIMHSKISVANKVTVSGKKGMLAGGVVVAGREINAASMGTNFATHTEVIVGEAVGLRDELHRMETELKAAVENLDKTKKGIQFLKDLQTKMGGNLPPEKKELLTKLTRAQFKLMADAKMLLEKKQELEKSEAEQSEDRKRHAKVTCMGMIHTGVKITINKASRQITEELKYCTLTESDGEIKVGPYK